MSKRFTAEERSELIRLIGEIRRTQGEIHEAVAAGKGLKEANLADQEAYDALMDYVFGGEDS